MRFDDYVEATNAAKTPEALFGVLERVVAQEGYTQFAYTSLSGPTPARVEAELAPPASVAVVFLKYPQPWIDHYVQDACHLVDPVIQLSQTLVRRYTWDWLLHQPHVERQSKILMMQAEEAGLRNGVTVPMVGPDGGSFVLNVAREDYGDDPADSVRFLHGIALQFHFAYCSIAEFRRARTDVVLSEKAVQCLTLSAAGLLPEEISDRMGIPEATVQHHLKAASAALGTRTLVQTVYEAIRAGLVPLEAIGKKNWRN